MMSQPIYVTLNTEAAERCRLHSTASLRAWLLREYETHCPAASQTATLFSTALEVEADVPLLLAALSLLTGRSADDLVETWALQLPPEPIAATPAPTAPPALTLSEERLGQLAELLDLGETLFEQTIAEARQRLDGDYPDSEQAEAAMAQLFHALRVLLKLAPAQGQAQAG